MTKPKIRTQCYYCGLIFETVFPHAKYCKNSHRIMDFRKKQIARLKELEARAAEK